jgi:4-amino-4-deoxy-L-arabinose transferase-like glycosyltransferase
MAVAWAALVRAPFFDLASGDDVFFAQIADQWLHGRLPYVGAFDVKPPGVFIALLAPVFLGGNNPWVLHAVSILGDAAAVLGLYRLAILMGDRRMGLWACALYPAFSAWTFNNVAYAVLEPLQIWAVAAALTAQGRRVGWIALAGLSSGCACMIKQPCAFETLALLGWLLREGLRAGRAIRGAVCFGVSAMIPGLAVCAYFAGNHALPALVHQTIVLALARAGDGPEGLGLADTLMRLVHMQRYLLAPLALAALAALRRREIAARLPQARLDLLGLWFAAALVGVFLQRASYPGYLACELPPLLLLSGAALATLLEPRPLRVRWALFAGALVAAGVASYAAASPASAYRDDMPALGVAARAIQARHPGADDHLLVLNRGLWLYGLTGLTPPTAYFHPMHLTCDFPGVGFAQLTDTLNARPRFVVVADRSVSFVCDTPVRWAAINAAISARYHPISHIAGRIDAFDIYERDAP